ncbi:ATP-binding cassette domain-containing protein [Alteromonas ponticola]|uniref:ATP-binding cassette domain-containing protein n=1 Tax=Alteromonas aquimaris TaxID=2998417 RepID=A0ABT3P551_9ALTE|nr:ATP-binding cassette domain-containing protein [Alteromonas aquimaris]MCW8107885.1 ATP-binding cassette domain-containing protein [Alteromonas aquimaris]
MSSLSLVNVSVGARLSQISAKVAKGTSVHLLGENGAGKSSLLQLIAGLLCADSGDVVYQGQMLKDIPLAQLATLRCFHQQSVQPVFDLPVNEYLGFYLQNYRDLPSPLEHVFELYHLLNKKITTLSGGELQRVELCRSLIQVWPAIGAGEALLVLDEPLQALDIRHQLAFLEYSRQLVDQGNTLVCSSHHIAQSARYADKIWCIQAGKLIAQGGAEDIITPHILKRTYQCHFDVKRHANTWQIDALGASDPP